jgi:hypothetical protein
VLNVIPSGPETKAPEPVGMTLPMA